MKNLLFLTAVTFGFSSLFINQCYAQIRNAIGISVGANHPLQSGYRVGKDWALLGNIRLNKRWALVPSLGAESVEGSRKGTYNGYYFTESGRSVGLAFLRVAGKYYFNKNIFVMAGPSLYVGGDDAGSSGIGGMAGIGYDWAFDDYSSLELAIRTDVRPVYDKTVPVAGLSITYKFNFSAKDPFRDAK